MAIFATSEYAAQIKRMGHERDLHEPCEADLVNQAYGLTAAEIDLHPRQARYTTSCQALYTSRWPCLIARSSAS